MGTWNNLKTFIYNIIGTYTPITTGEGVGTVDWPFVIAGILFILLVYQFFKIIFRIFK